MCFGDLAGRRDREGDNDVDYNRFPIYKVSPKYSVSF